MNKRHFSARNRAIWPRKRSPAPLSSSRSGDCFSPPAAPAARWVSTNGWIRCAGPLASSTVFCPLRATAVTSVPCPPGRGSSRCRRGRRHRDVAVVVAGVYVGEEFFQQKILMVGRPAVGSLAVAVSGETLAVADAGDRVDRVRPRAGRASSRRGRSRRRSRRYGRRPAPVW